MDFINPIHDENQEINRVMRPYVKLEWYALKKDKKTAIIQVQLLSKMDGMLRSADISLLFHVTIDDLARRMNKTSEEILSIESYKMLAAPKSLISLDEIKNYLNAAYLVESP